MLKTIWSIMITFFILSPVNFSWESDAKIPTGRILHVGGTGPGNYSKIMDAVKDAENGDTIIIHKDSSPYKENIVIKNKSITLVGESPDVIINGAKYVHHNETVHRIETIETNLSSILSIDSKMRAMLVLQEFSIDIEDDDSDENSTVREMQCYKIELAVGCGMQGLSMKAYVLKKNDSINIFDQIEEAESKKQYAVIDIPKHTKPNFSICKENFKKGIEVENGKYYLVLKLPTLQRGELYLGSSFRKNKSFLLYSTDPGWTENEGEIFFRLYIKVFHRISYKTNKGICLNIDGCENIKVYNLSFVGGWKAVNIKDSTNIVMDSCSVNRLDNGTGPDIYVIRSSYCLLRNMDIHYSGVHIIRCNDIQIEKCKFTELKSFAIYVSDSNQVAIRDNIIKESKRTCRAIIVDFSNHTTIEDNLIQLSPTLDKRLVRSEIFVANYFAFMVLLELLMDHINKSRQNQSLVNWSHIHKHLYDLGDDLIDSLLGLENSGIGIYFCADSFLYRNRISGCNAGIVLYDVLRTRVKRNHISNNLIGISLINNMLGIFFDAFPNCQNITLAKWLLWREYLLENPITIAENNFCDNGIDALPMCFWGIRLIRWRGNYWERPRALPHRILSFVGVLPLAPGTFQPIPVALFYQFDPLPAKLPYKIETLVSE